MLCAGKHTPVDIGVMGGEHAGLNGDLPKLNRTDRQRLGTVVQNGNVDGMEHLQPRSAP